jgi:predicted nucleotidyltransferase
MKKYSEINLKKFRQEGLKEILDIMETVFNEIGIDFYYLIGAVARDIWFEKEKINSRTTKDIDFAILISDISQFEFAKDLLKQNHQFTLVKGNEFALVSPKGITIDLLPFGALETNDGSTIDVIGLHNIKVNGFKEIAKTGVVEVHSEENTFNVATLSSIILLKLISFDDRPEHRQKDPADIASIIQVFFNIESSTFFDTYFDLLERIDEGKDIIAARCVGRQLKGILNENDALKKRITNILQRHITAKNGNTFTEIMAQSSNQTIEQINALLSEISMGIEDEYE